MGNILCCIREKKKRELNDHLVRYMYCEQCQQLYLSNYEYNKHIYVCNKKYNNSKS